MKKTIFIAALLACFCCAFASEIPFGVSGGKIVSTTDGAYTVETGVGVTTVHKSDAQHKKNKGVVDFRASSFLKDNIDYVAYKKNLKIGLGFFIPGTVFMATPLLFFTGLAVTAFRNYDPAQDNADIVSGLSCYFLSIGLGLILELISIPFFVTADNHYKRAVERCKVSFNAGFSNDSLKMAMNVSF